MIHVYRRHSRADHAIIKNNTVGESLKVSPPLAVSVSLQSFGGGQQLGLGWLDSDQPIFLDGNIEPLDSAFVLALGASIQYSGMIIGHIQL